MARIPESEIERLKLSVSLERLVESAGVELRRHGKDRIGRCPFHDDKTPSLVVSPKTNLWHCLGACQAGGSVIDWVMRSENVSFRRAVELLREQAGQAPSLLDRMEAPAVSAPGPAKGHRKRQQAEAMRLASAEDQALLNQVTGFYHAALKQSPEVLAYLQKRGLTHPALIDYFRLGFANRTLGYQLPVMQVKAGAALRGALQRIGVYRGSGHEHFTGSLIVPVIDANGDVTELYGRKIGERLREGTPLHLYLPGPHRGVFNEAGLIGQDEAILCESLIDALTFWCAGYRNVTSSYGIEGFTDDILAALQRHGIRRVLIAYDADAAGNAAALKLAERLMAEGFACYRVRWPQGMDANAYAVQGRTNVAGAGSAGATALSVASPGEALGERIRRAEWLGEGREPERVVPVPIEAPAPCPVPSLTAAVALSTNELPVLRDAPTPAAAGAPVPAAALPPLPSTPPVVVTAQDVTLVLGDRRYRVRGLEKNLAYDVLKVNVRVSCGEAMHVDTLDLYQAKARAVFVRLAAVEIGVDESVVNRDLGQLLLALEAQQDVLIAERLRTAQAPQGASAVLEAQEEAAGLALLRDPQLIDRIAADVEASGVVGETSNALVAYLACVSRKLDKPLAVLIQSTSAAGKSTLMDALLALMPEAERVHYSAMTGQSLFYLGETSMKHKILAIAEEEGVRQAAYALKVLQSQGELTIASTGKDPATGQLVTQEYRVEGPVMLFLTTTAIDVDEELLNRCLVLTINESREQTAAIQARQRKARTLDGLLAKARADDVLSAHRAAQALLRPLAVVNPFAERLTFASDRVRLRRDHAKYLALIDSIALLHQYQRTIRSVAQAGQVIEYVEVTEQDIALANRLAHEVLGRSLDELPPPTRRVLAQTADYVRSRAAAQGIEYRLVRFTRRELREAIALSEKQLRVHLDRLVELEYVLAHAGRNGQRFVYELAFDGDAASDAPQLMGLVTMGAGTTTNLVAESDNLVPGSWPARGDLGAASCTAETPLKASADAVPPALVAAVEGTARPRKASSSRRNGASYA